MKFDHHNILVVDLEATCWAKPGDEGLGPEFKKLFHKGKAIYPKPKNEINEIIEIGICILNTTTKEITDKRSILVKPVMSKVSEFCTLLTGHTQEELDASGITYAEACQILREEYNSEFRNFASYGNYDRDTIRNQCTRFKISYPMSNRHTNVKNLITLVQCRSKETGAKKCLEDWVGEKFEGRHHNGADDAYNIAKILRAALWSRREC